MTVLRAFVAVSLCGCVGSLYDCVGSLCGCVEYSVIAVMLLHVYDCGMRYVYMTCSVVAVVLLHIYDCGIRYMYVTCSV